MRRQAATCAIALFAAWSAGGFQKGRERMTLFEQIPVEVRDYLTAGDGLAKASVKERYPNVQQTLASHECRAAVLRYLESDEPWKQPNVGFLINALAYLQAAANAKEAPVALKLAGYPNAWVRVRADEYLMGVYYPAGDRASMVKMYERMLNDSDEVVRVQAARWIKGTNAAAEMRGYLQDWISRAAERHWDHQESFTLVQEALH
ncbi:MAG TPA: hypothetical protein VE959_01270 [Bryobacteraceae bacterium]|nr:hypothetical protein [Bryobacteraceae bacterium]